MEERASSVASSADFYGTEAPVVESRDAKNNMAQAATKRKAEDAPTAQDKRRKLVSPFRPVSSSLTPCAGLPPAVWQHVFLSCSLADLGRLMQVNRPFLSYLTDVHNVALFTPGPGSLRLLKSESVWASARNALSPRPPKPLPGFTEAQMWQLAWSRRCQFCNELSSYTPGEKIWQKGPGAGGVRAIWPFGIRACGPCLVEQCQTDTSLLFSAASALRPALPFALITKDSNYIAAHALQSTNLPPDVEVGKYYYKRHVEDIMQELNDVLSRGPAAAEEWSKGLEVAGKERMRVADNWERWEARHVQQRQRATSAVPSLAAPSQKEPSRSPARQVSSPVIHTPVPMGKYDSAVPFAVKHSGTSRQFSATPLVPTLTTTAPSSQYSPSRPPTVPPQVFTPQLGQTGSTQPSHQRNLHDANEAKASRKTDIERRCQQLNPPIPPNILRHMDSFKAAIQISQPMTDYAWSVLQPRLVAQLPAAQQAEANHVSHAASLPTKPADRRFQDVNSKEAKEAMDREWEDLQRPIRDRLSAIADDFINQDWDQGKALTFDSCPKFAADLLAHVRRKYLDDKALQDTDDAGSKPKLVLENMKWVYDNKIKPLTELFRKDLFYCNADCDSNTRPYGFEGVVQHFAAKHTHTFSSGNVVVAWREAEWPEDPPFNPDPLSVQSLHNGHASASGYPGTFGAFSRAGTATPHMPMHMPQASPGPYGYGGHYTGPFHPPQTPGAPLAGYEYGQQYGTPVDTYAYAAMGPPGYGPQMGSGSYMPSPAMMNPAVAPPPAMQPPAHTAHDMAPAVSENTGHSTSLFDKQVSTVIDLSQEIWKQTSGIKDMPNSLRVYVLLHRVISRFQVEFNHEPNLTHFIDALSNHEMPKNLKLAPGLSCKACQMETSHHLTGAHYAKPMERKTYTVLSLLSHFRTHHLAPQPYNAYGQQGQSLDWKEDMIELPSDRFISGLLHAPGMDDDKLLMLATIFPSLFPMPLPKIGVIDSNGIASPSLSGSKDAVPTSGSSGDVQSKSGQSFTSAQIESPGLTKPLEDEYDFLGTESSAHTTELHSAMKRQPSHRESPQSDRRHRVHTEPRYHVGDLRSSVQDIEKTDFQMQQLSRDTMEDGYPHPRDYLEYPPSPRVVHAGSGYGEYSGLRGGFREDERIYGPPPHGMVYTQPREGSHGREYEIYTRQPRYYDEGDSRPEFRYVREDQSREVGLGRGQSAADRFLEDFDPAQAMAAEPVPQPQTQPPEPNPAAPDGDAPEPPRFVTPPPPSLAMAKEPELPPRHLAASHPRAPSTVSNGSRYEDYHSTGRHIPTPDSAAPPRRVGPQRRRDRPHEHRMPSRYFRYMSVARDEPYGRGPSMSRSQSRRYEEQRRQIVQQETPQPNAEPDFEPAFSREQSADRDDRYYPRHREYVSVQDRLHPHAYSPPRYHRYDEPRQPVYLDDYSYEVVRVRGEPRRPYVPARYEPERYEYVPVPSSYERPPQQRYNSRGEYVYYEDRERERVVPRRAAAAGGRIEGEGEGPEIKVESVGERMTGEGA